MTQTEIDPKFCNFCQDALPEGEMLIVLAPTQNVLARSGFLICARCGLTHTDTRVAENPETDEVAVLQFEHARFNEEEAEPTIQHLLAQIEVMSCHVCGAVLYEDHPEQVAPTKRDLVLKMLRLNPDAYSIKATCAECSSLGLCSCCDPRREDS